ncbi:MAG: YHS domain-containing protein [Candidatus Aenigmarchaeota archaeon]|nr:YHS domain-containing protein [Candidatus Aenigmarchaeota archaeon]
MLVRDPVCGMDVDEKSAIKKEHKGKFYFFCSKNCEQNFSNNPEKFAK